MRLSFKLYDLFVTNWRIVVPFRTKKLLNLRISNNKRRITAAKKLKPKFLVKIIQKSLNFSVHKKYLGSQMDEKDKQIIQLLKKNGRASYGNLGNKVGLSEGAIRKRIKTLTNSGVIRKFTVKIGEVEGAEAITLLATSPSSPTQEVSKRIKEIPNVETIYEVTGEYDIVAVITGMNVVEVNECIEKIRRVNGIMKTNTMIVLRSR